MKSYTDLEQSKKLAEILPIKSADMSYDWFVIGKEYSSIPQCRKFIDDELPCWSLAALIDILPQGTRILKSSTNDTYHCDCPKENIDKWFDNPIDACVEIIIKLHEQKLL